MRQNEDVIALSIPVNQNLQGKARVLTNQVELGKEYVRVHFGDAAVDKIVVYEDEGFSGGNLNRPAFKRMMDAAKSDSLRQSLSIVSDRISRNVSDFSGLIGRTCPFEYFFYFHQGAV